MKRCTWVPNQPLYKKYHDEEWGVPLHDDRLLFEMLILEGFQAGLSWWIVLKKRFAFREAFDDFDVQKVAAYDEKKIEELMQNKNIIRSRAKIKAAVENARIFQTIQVQFGSFDRYIWHFTQGKSIRGTTFPPPARNDFSDQIAADLKKRQMKYVGSVIIYSYLQAIGVINDHEPDCFCFKKVNNGA